MALSLMAWLECIFRFFSFLISRESPDFLRFQNFFEIFEKLNIFRIFILSNFLIIFRILLHFCQNFTYSITFFKDLRFAPILQHRPILQRFFASRRCTVIIQSHQIVENQFFSIFTIIGIFRSTNNGEMANNRRGDCIFSDTISETYIQKVGW